MKRILTEWRKYLAERKGANIETLRLIAANPGSCVNDQGHYSGKDTPECKQQRAAKAKGASTKARTPPKKAMAASSVGKKIKKKAVANFCLTAKEGAWVPSMPFRCKGKTAVRISDDEEDVILGRYEGMHELAEAAVEAAVNKVAERAWAEFYAEGPDATGEKWKKTWGAVDRLKRVDREAAEALSWYNEVPEIKSSGRDDPAKYLIYSEKHINNSVKNFKGAVESIRKNWPGKEAPDDSAFKNLERAHLKHLKTVQKEAIDLLKLGFDF